MIANNDLKVTNSFNSGNDGNSYDVGIVSLWSESFQTNVAAKKIFLQHSWFTFLKTSSRELGRWVPRVKLEYCNGEREEEKERERKREGESNKRIV